MSDNDPVSLAIGGQRHERWRSYSIDSDLLVPADAWQVRVTVHGPRPAIITRAAPVTVRIGDDLVLSGRIEGIRQRVNKHGHMVTLNGRDDAAILVDCSAPIFAAQQIGLDEIVSRIVKPLGIKNVQLSASTARQRAKVNIEPGDTAWQALQNAAEANGLWPWMNPDGTLVIGGPDYNAPPVASLILRLDGGLDSNIEDIDMEDDIAQAYSEVTVLSQVRGSEDIDAQPAVKRTWKDDSLPVYRPKVVVDHESDTGEFAQDRARKLLQDSRLKAFTLKVQVGGHRINAPGTPSHDKLWQPGQRVHVLSEPHGIDDVFFLMGRTFIGGRDQATVTHLRLKEDAMWIVEAHPHKGRKKKGKKAPGTAQTLEVKQP